MMNMQAYRMLQERNEKEFRYFRLSDKYFPKYKEPVLAGKFYARHECKNLADADPDVVDTIKKYCDKGPKEKYEWPATENQVYGWFNKPLVATDRNDPRLYFPTVFCSITKDEMALRKVSRIFNLKTKPN